MLAENFSSISMLKSIKSMFYNLIHFSKTHKGYFNNTTIFGFNFNRPNSITYPCRSSVAELYSYLIY